MRTSRDPLQPLRSWKELFFGTRNFNVKKFMRVREHLANAKVNVSVLPASPDPAHAD